MSDDKGDRFSLLSPEEIAFLFEACIEVERVIESWYDDEAGHLPTDEEMIFLAEHAKNCISRAHDDFADILTRPVAQPKFRNKT